MSFTDPAFVEIYEQIDGDRTIDMEFYLEIASKARGTVLEAGCGSGRILLNIAQRGIMIEGFDPSQAMLDVLKERAKKTGATLNVWQGDFSTIKSKYATVISPFNSLMHLLDQDAQIDAFKRVYQSLETGGTFAFDIVNPYTLDIYDDSRQFESSFTRAGSDTTTEIWRWFEHAPISQTGSYHREFVSDDETLHSVIDFRWSYPSEIALLLRMSGFTSFEVFGGFNVEDLTDDATSQVWIARK